MSPVDSLRTETKFKKTEIGEIPVDWEVMSLGNISEDIYRYPSYYSIKYVEEGIPEVRGELIKSNGTLESDLFLYRFISKETALKFPKTCLTEGDFVISVRGTMGKIAMIPKSLEGANITANLIRISPNRRIVHPPWLRQVFLSKKFQEKLNNASSSTTIKTIKAPEIKSFKLAVPPIFEQKRIADILSSVGKAIENKQEIIEKTKWLKKGLIQELLTRGIGHTKFKKTEIGEIPADWRVVQVKDVSGKPEYGYTASAIEKPVGPKFLRITDIQNGHVNWSLVPYCYFPDSTKRKYILKSGDILFARTGATTGKSFLIQDCPEAVFASYLIRITPTSKIRSQFLNFVFNSHIYWKQIRQALSGSAQGGVNATFLSKIKIPLPPVGEQELIATIMSEIDTLIEKELRQETTLANMKKGLMERLLTGKIRVS